MDATDGAALEAAAGALIDRCALGAVLVSLDGGGATVVEAGGAVHREAAAAEVGVAFFAAALGSGLTARTALHLAASGGHIR
jgi:hypothetical protein